MKHLKGTLTGLLVGAIVLGVLAGVLTSFTVLSELIASFIGYPEYAEGISLVLAWLATGAVIGYVFSLIIHENGTWKS